MKFQLVRNEKPVEVSPGDLTASELCNYLSQLHIDTSECWTPETAKKECWAAINEAIRRIKAKHEPKSFPEIVAEMRQFYEANKGFPVSAGSMMGYARELEALVNFLFPMKNANRYRDANEAYRAWKRQGHEVPENAQLPQWVKDFVNWVMALQEAEG